MHPFNYLYQHQMLRALFRSAGLASCIIALINYGLRPEWPQLVHGGIAAGTAGLMWLCAYWLPQGNANPLIARIGLGSLLVVDISMVLTAPPEFVVIGMLGVAVVILIVTFVDDQTTTIVWSLSGGLLVFVGLAVRSWVPELTLHLAREIQVILVLVTPVLLWLFIQIGLKLKRQYRETLAHYESMRRDLQQSEWQYQQLLQSMNEGFVIVDEEEKFVYVNNMFCEILGYKREELLHHRNEDILPYDEANLALLRQETAMRHQHQKSTYELTTQRKNGQTLILRVSAQPNLDSTSTFCGTVAVVTDITAQKQAEEALKAERALLSQRVEERTAILRQTNDVLQQELRERKLAEEALKAAEEEYRALFENVQIGLYRSSLDGHQLRANPTLVRLNGYNTEAEQLANVNDIAREWYVDPHRRAEFKRLLDEQDTITSFESEIYCHRTRERIWISESATLIRDEVGNPQYYQGSVLDITARKESEFEHERLIAELAKAVQLKDEFLASVSHELRTPLNGMLGLAESLQTGIYGALEPRPKQVLSTIESSGQHLLSLINDILDLSKIEAGQFELTLDYVNIEQICRESLRVINATAQRKKQQVNLMLAQQPAALVADPRRLKQILINLLSNAVKFTPAYGEISLQVSDNIIAGQTHVSGVRFVVSDNGCGIEDQMQEQIFAPFVQVDSSMTRQHEGTGLGLTLVQRMVELHGGMVMVESQAGQGSRFIVDLPQMDLAKPLTPEPNLSPNGTWREPRPAQNNGASASDLSQVSEADSAALVLLAEDNEVSAEAMTEFLLFYGYSVEVACNGIEAVEKAKTLDPALVFMDMQMPEMDGLEAIRQIRADTRYAELPIVALTAMAMRGDDERCRAAGATGYMSKPVSLEVLLQTVEKYTRQPAIQYDPI